MSYEKFCQKIGLKIKYYRQLNHLTQSYFAEKINMDVRYLSDIECGKKNITLKTIYKLAQNLDIKPEDLFIFPNK